MALSSSDGSYDVFIAKLDPADGTFLSAERAGGIGLDIGVGIAVDSQGNIYAAGGFEATADFPNGDVLTSAGDRDMFRKVFAGPPLPGVVDDDGIANPEFGVITILGTVGVDHVDNVAVDDEFIAVLVDLDLAREWPVNRITSQQARPFCKIVVTAGSNDDRA